MRCLEPITYPFKHKSNPKLCESYSLNIDHCSFSLDMELLSYEKRSTNHAYSSPSEETISLESITTIGLFVHVCPCYVHLALLLRDVEPTHKTAQYEFPSLSKQKLPTPLWISKELLHSLQQSFEKNGSLE